MFKYILTIGYSVSCTEYRFVIVNNVDKTLGLTHNRTENQLRTEIAIKNRSDRLRV